jgi:hypothetical protein
MAIKVKVRCTGPLHHGAFGDDAGNAALFRRERVVGIEGMPEVPVVSGNAVRGVLRRIVMRGLLDRCGITAEEMEPRDYQRLYAAVANGGHLDSSKGTAVDTDYIRALRTALPPVSLFGAAFYSWQLEGNLLSTFLWPHCTETYEAGLVEDAGDGRLAEELVTEVTHTRHIEREHHNPDVSGVTPMPTTIEALATNTILSGEFWFKRPDELEASVLAWGLERLRILGGKSGAGLGRLDVAHDGDPKPYDEWLESSAEDAGAALRELAATL